MLLGWKRATALLGGAAQARPTAVSSPTAETDDRLHYLPVGPPLRRHATALGRPTTVGSAGVGGDRPRGGPRESARHATDGATPTPEPDEGPFGCMRFPPNGFAVSLTLFPKCFSPFPHGTCSLSVLCPCSALDGVYHPLWAAISNNPTLGTR